MNKEIEELIGKLYYKDREKRQRIVQRVNKIYGVNITIEDVERIVRNETRYQPNKPTQRYRKKVSPVVIAQWLYKKYTIEQIKEEASKMNLQVLEEDIEKAIRIYEEVKAKHCKTTEQSIVINNRGEGR